MAGKVVSSTGSKVQLWAVEKSRAAASPGSFSGWASAQPIAWRMSGGLAWAMVEPSIRVAIEWTMDCGWTTTSTRCSGRSNRKQASITSRALLTRVAELVVITGPIAQVGWARACSGSISASWSRVRPRKGPPEAVTTSRSTCSGRTRAEERRVGKEGRSQGGRYTEKRHGGQGGAEDG